jgi:hypothetical protein
VGGENSETRSGSDAESAQSSGFVAQLRRWFS